MFNEARVALRAFSQTYHCHFARFSSSTSESGLGGSDIDDSALRFHLRTLSLISNFYLTFLYTL